METRLEKRAGFPGQRIIIVPRRALVAMMLRRPPLRGLALAGAGYYPKATHHLRRRPKGIDQVIFIYCVKGAGWCEIGGRFHPVHKGDLLVLPPGLPHNYGADVKQPWTIHWIHAIGSHVADYLKELGVSEERPVVWMGEDVQLIALFQEALAAVEHDYSPVDLLHGSHTLAHLISLMIRHRHERSRGAPDTEQKLAQSIAYMKQHLNQPLRVATLAALANLSPSHFTTLFRKTTGHSPHEYLNRLRIHRACQLLDGTGLSMKEIAFSLGYQDPFHFSRIFKSQKKVSPSEYRAGRRS